MIKKKQRMSKSAGSGASPQPAPDEEKRLKSGDGTAISDHLSEDLRNRIPAAVSRSGRDSNRGERGPPRKLEDLRLPIIRSGAG